MFWGSPAVLDYISGHILELIKRRKLRKSTQMFQRQLLPHLIVKYTLKSFIYSPTDAQVKCLKKIFKNLH